MKRQVVRLSPDVKSQLDKIKNKMESYDEVIKSLLANPDRAGVELKDLKLKYEQLELNSRIDYNQLRDKHNNLVYKYNALGKLHYDKGKE